MGLGGPGNGGKPRENACFFNVEIWAPLHSHYIFLYMHQFVGKQQKNKEHSKNMHFWMGLGGLGNGGKPRENMCFLNVEVLAPWPPYIPITFPCIFTSLWENTAKNKKHSINMHFWMGLGGPGNGGKP